MSDVGEMYELALALKGGNPQGALAMIRTGAFQKFWAEQSAQKANAAYAEYLDKLRAEYGEAP